MTERDLKKLSRADLLQMLIDQSEELEAVREKLNRTEATLRDRTLAIDKAGSLAEASLQLSGIFEAADESCRQYTENIRLLSERQEAICNELEQQHRQRIDRELEETRQACQTMEAETTARCKEMVETAEAEAKAWWDNASAKLDQYVTEHRGLRDLLTILAAKKQE